MEMAYLTRAVETVYGDEDKTLLIGNTVEICSGGTRKNERDELPALYLSETAAVNAWTDSVAKALEKPIRWKWADKPVMRQLQITMTDMREQERLVQNRWAVTAKITYTTVEKSNVSSTEASEVK